MKMPVNFDLLVIHKEELPKFGQIKELQIFGQGSNFHQDGLFSVQIFGAVGSESRNSVFGYIDLKYEMLHPAVYKAVISLGSVYKAVLEGSKTAIWDKKTRNFVLSNEEGASTGYSFFMEHFEEIQFPRTKSDKRAFNIALVERSAKTKTYMLRYLLVMPSGRRDYVVNQNGKPEEDEINTYYRRLLAQSQLIDPIIASKNPSVYDAVLHNIQKALVDLYNQFQDLFDGKNKLVLAKWLGRKTFNSTRNVLIAPVDTVDDMQDKNRLLSNQAGIGLYQFLRAAAPLSLYEIRNRYISGRVFSENNNYSSLVNLKTLQREDVISASIQKDYDLWMTPDGLESVIANFGNLDTRHLPVLVGKGKYALALIYNDGKHVKVFQDMNTFPSHLNKDHVSQITYSELLYLSVADMSDKTPCLLTRYPINGYGGIFPAYMKVRTTAKYQKVTELDDNWQPTERMLPTFPLRGVDFLNGMSVHQSHMSLLGADMDGDTLSCVGLLSEEAMEETRAVLDSKSYYFNDERKVIFSNSADVLNSVLSFMTEHYD